MTRTFSRALPLALAAAIGCGGAADGRRPVFPVEGRLTYGGEPMGGAMMTFHPLDDPGPRALRAQATADADGRFRLTTYAADDGAPPGRYAVTLYWPGPRAGRAKPGEEGEDMPPDRLHRAYTVPSATTLRATVRERANTIDFTLP